MTQRNLARTGLRVGAIGFGAMPMTAVYGPVMGGRRLPEAAEGMTGS